MPSGLDFDLQAHALPQREEPVPVRGLVRALGRLEVGEDVDEEDAQVADDKKNSRGARS